MSNQEIRLVRRPETETLDLCCIICDETVAWFTLEYLPTLDIVAEAPRRHLSSRQHLQRAAMTVRPVMATEFWSP